MNTRKFDSPTEALADAWASIDGKLDQFRADKANPDADPMAGWYEGRMEDAKELRRRLRARGFLITKQRPPRRRPIR